MTFDICCLFPVLILRHVFTSTCVERVDVSVSLLVDSWQTCSPAPVINPQNIGRCFLSAAQWEQKSTVGKGEEGSQLKTWILCDVLGPHLHRPSQAKLAVKSPLSSFWWPMSDVGGWVTRSVEIVGRKGSRGMTMLKVVAEGGGG